MTEEVISRIPIPKISFEISDKTIEKKRDDKDQNKRGKYNKTGKNKV